MTTVVTIKSWSKLRETKASATASEQPLGTPACPVIGAFRKHLLTNAPAFTPHGAATTISTSPVRTLRRRRGKQLGQGYTAVSSNPAAETDAPGLRACTLAY